MSFKKNFKKIMSLTAVTAMTFSMVGCNFEFGPMTTERLLTKMEENAVINDAVVEQLIADDVITGEEVEVLMNNIKSFKGEVAIDFVGGIEMSMEGVSQSIEADGSISADYQYDSKSKSAMLDLNVEANAMGEELDETMSIYLINEDGTYYGYTQEGDEVALREELGDEEELWEDLELDVDDLLDELDLDSKDELVDMFKTSSLKDVQEDLVLSKEKVEFEGKECYELLYHFNGETILDELEENEEIAQSLEDEMGYTVDELLEEEIADDYTIEDLIKDFSFDVTYYVDSEEYYITYIEVDLKPTFDKLSETLVDLVIAEMGSEYEDMEITIDIEKASMSVTYIETEDVDVEFDGDYEDADSYYDDYDEYDYEYDDEYDF